MSNSNNKCSSPLCVLPSGHPENCRTFIPNQDQEMTLIRTYDFRGITPIEPKQGLRFDQGKVRMGLDSPIAAVGRARVLTKGAIKYADHNWRKGMPWSKCIDSLKRHLIKYESGEDYDTDPKCEGCKSNTCINHTGELHIDQIQVNAMFLSEYFHTHKHHDDRYKVSLPSSDLGNKADKSDAAPKSETNSGDKKGQ